MFPRIVILKTVLLLSYIIYLHKHMPIERTSIATSLLFLVFFGRSIGIFKRHSIGALDDEWRLRHLCSEFCLFRTRGGLD